MSIRDPRNPAGRVVTWLLTAGALAGAASALASEGAEQARTSAAKFTNPTQITNPWMPLSKLHRTELRGVKDGVKVRSVRTTLTRTRAFRIGGKVVRAAILEDRVFKGGKLHEISLDYFVQSDAGSVYFLGQSAAIYNKAGTRVVTREASLYGRDKRALGVAMPARPKPGDRFTYERIPEESETNRVVSVTARVSVPFGTFRRALQVAAYVLPDKEREIAWYGRGAGLIQEKDPAGVAELVSVKRR